MACGRARELSHNYLSIVYLNDIYQSGREASTADRMSKVLPDGLKVLGTPWLKGQVYVICPINVFPVPIIRLLAACIDTAYVHRRIDRVSEEDRLVLSQSLKGKHQLAPTFVVGSWATVRHGQFAGDIARVRAVEEGTDVVDVEVVPRLWERPGKRPRTRRRIDRAPKTLFYRELVERRPGFNSNMIQAGKETGSCIINNEEEYLRNGLRVLKIAGLHCLQQCQPNASELELFTIAGVNTLRETNREFLQVKDDVVILRGEFAGKLGCVKWKDDQEARVQLYNEKEASVSFELSQVRRYFRIGDSIAVRIGMVSGRRGMVVEVSETNLTFVDFSTKEEVRIPNLIYHCVFTRSTVDCAVCFRFEGGRRI